MSRLVLLGCVLLSVVLNACNIARAQDKLDPELERLIGTWVVEELTLGDPTPLNDWEAKLNAMTPWPVQIERKGPNLNACSMRILPHRETTLELGPPKAGEFPVLYFGSQLGVIRREEGRLKFTLKFDGVRKESVIVLSRTGDLDAERPAEPPEGTWVMMPTRLDSKGYCIFQDLDVVRELPAIQVSKDSVATLKFSSDGLTKTPSLLGGTFTPDMKFVPAKNFPTIVKNFPAMVASPSVPFSYSFNERAGIMWRSSGDLYLFANQEVASILLPAALASVKKQDEDKRKRIEEANRAMELKKLKELKKRQQRAEEAWRIVQMRLREGRIDDARSALETIIAKLSDTTIAPKAKEALDKLTPVPAKAER